MGPMFLLLFIVGLLLALSGGVIGAVEAFRTSAVWGLVYLLIPFAALVFFFKFWGRKWVRNSFLMGLGGGLLLFLSGLFGGFDLLRGGPAVVEIEEVPGPESEPTNGEGAAAGEASEETAAEEAEAQPEGAAEEQAEEEGFEDPLVAATTTPTALARSELIQSTDPRERVQQINRSRSNPFSAVPVPPPPTAAPPTRPTAPGAQAGGRTPQAGANVPSPGNGQPGGGNGRQPGGTPPGNGGDVAVAPPPSTDLAEAVQITGVIRIGNQNYAIINAPNEATSRYVRVGQRIANNQVLLKRIDFDGNGDPLVILEENGVEIAQPVGPQDSMDNGTTASLEVPPQTIANLATESSR